MSELFINPYRRSGRPRCPKRYLIALEYLLWPGKKPYGLQKQLAVANDICPVRLAETVTTIVKHARSREWKP